MNGQATLLVHFGTPRSSHPLDIYHFLVEVFDGALGGRHSISQKVLSRLLLAPLAMRSTSYKYHRLSNPAGFPLPVHLSQLLQDLRPRVGDKAIFLAMQHGRPSIEEVCQDIVHQGYETVFVLPLYPQTVPGMTKSILLRAKESLLRTQSSVSVHFCEGFHSASWYIDPLVETLQNHPTEYDSILFSYHSVLERHGKDYRAQCQETAELVMKKAGSRVSWDIGFQSRMKFGKWLSKQSDEVLTEFLRKGLRRVLVVAPSFITPCSETVIDIEENLRTFYLSKGGNCLSLLPSLCTQEAFISQFASYLRKGHKAGPSSTS